MNLIAAIALLGGAAFAQDDGPPETETETPTEESSEPSTDAPEPEPESEPEAPDGPSQADLDRAVELFQNGKTLFDEAAYKDAVTAWEESYRLSKKPALLFNIASAYERMADFDGALEALNRYRAFAKPDEKEALDRRMRNLEKAAEEAAAAAVPPDPTDTPKEKKPGQAQRAAGLGLVGAGVVSAGTGLALGLVSQSAGANAETSCIDGLCLDTSKGDVDANTSMALGADVALLGGAALAVVGVAVFATAPKAKLTVGPNSIHLSGRF